MRSHSVIVATTLFIMCVSALAQTPAPVPATPPVVTIAPTPPAEAPVAAPAAPDVAADGIAEESSDDMSIGDIPLVETQELTAEIARKALDAYVLVQTKYQESPLESYETLQDFVDKDPRGKEFETDIKSFNFAAVNDWNLAITTLSFAYTNVLDDQSTEIKDQIEELKTNTEIAQDVKDRMISSLNAMIPSANNTKIVNDLIADAVYGEKVKLLESTEE